MTVAMSYIEYHRQKESQQIELRTGMPFSFYVGSSGHRPVCVLLKGYAPGKLPNDNALIYELAYIVNKTL